MLPPIGYHRLTASTTLAVLHATLAVAHSFPTLIIGYPPPPPLRRVSIIIYIDSLGPVWQILFGTTAVALLAALLLRRELLALTHTVSGAAAAMYATALWLGFVLSDPGPSILPALGFTSVVMSHLTIGVTYARMLPLSPVVRSVHRHRKAHR